MSCWSTLRKQCFLSQEGCWQYHTCHTSEYGSFHFSAFRQEGSVHSINSWCKPPSYFQYHFQLVAGRKWRVHFPCSISHYDGMLRILFLGVLVRRPFLLCVLRPNIILFCLSWRAKRPKEDKFREDSLQGVHSACSQLCEVWAIGRGQEPNNWKTCIPDVSPLYLHPAELHSPLILKKSA